MPNFNANQLRQIGTSIFGAMGAPRDIAERVADSLVKSDLVGHDSHGIMRVITYYEFVKRKEIDPSARPEVAQETPCTASVNGHWGFGQVAAEYAMKLCVKKAMAGSIGAVSLFKSNHIGRLGEYAMMAAEQDMIGMVMCNVGPCLVAPYGGKSRQLGTNPLSVAAPAGKMKPFLIDFATSIAAEGKIRMKYYNNEKVPLGWVMDEKGRLTENPGELYYKEGDQIIIDGHRYRGCILPFGGHKGYALSLLMDILGGALTGAGCTSSEEFERGNGAFMMTIDISRFTPLNEFKRKVDNLFVNLKSSEPASGHSEVLIPGEPEFREKEKRLKEGINIPEKVWHGISAVAEELGLNPERLLRE